MHQFTVKTHAKVELLDITERVRSAFAQQYVKDGLCHVFIPHTTAGITINENADPAVVQDLLKELNRMVPFDDDYAHGEGNSAAHIKASLMGFSVAVPVEGGQLVLGTWQGIYLCEFDGPRSRRVVVTALSQKFEV